ncbi:MAG: NADH-quinone oxidoreductase subunit J [Acidimicrobiales bacterium]|nr:NADH-quinone oxidoreductase subunit J [Acidimicrobiales bacterium]
MEMAVFLVSAAVVLGGALGVVLLRNTVHCALSLIATLFGVAVLFLNQNAQFLAAVQVIVYAGAIVVLFLFVIMLVGVDRAEDLSIEPIPYQRWIAGVLGLATLVLVVVAVAVSVDGATGTEAATAALDEAGNVQQLGRLLFTDYVFAVEITAILLTIAVVGAVALARKPKGDLEPLPEIEPAWPLARPAEPSVDDAESDTDIGGDAGTAESEAATTEEVSG